MRQLSWLGDHPIAHRGLHGAPNGYGQNAIENTLAACEAAMSNGFAMEVDLQLSGDDVPMLFHDSTLDRLTDQSGLLRSASADQLARIPIIGSAETIPRFADLLTLIEGKVPLVIELKHQYGDKTYTLAKRAAEIAADYHGELSFISFDPFLLGALYKCAPQFLRGIVVDRGDEAEFLEQTSWLQRIILRNLLHYRKSRFDFVSCDQHALTLPAIKMLKRRGMQMMSWTIRSATQATEARRTANQIVFEGFAPE